MNKKTFIPLLLSIMTSFSSFSTGNDCNNQNSNQIERNNNQTKAIIRMTFSDLTEAEHQEIFELTLPILKKRTNSDFYAKKIFFDGVNQLKNTNNLKQQFEFINNILQKIESDNISFTSIALELFKIDPKQYDPIYFFLQNVEQINLNIQKNIPCFVEILKQINDETIKTLMEWQQILFFMLHYNLFQDEYTDFIQFIIKNPFPATLTSYIDLLNQQKIHHDNFFNTHLIKDIIHNNENDFNHALPLLEKIFTIYPSWTAKDCQSISSYILSRASSSNFQECFNITCTLFKNKNWAANDYINCINHLYNLQTPYEFFNDILQPINSILPQSIDLDWSDYETLIDILLSNLNSGLG